MSSEVITIKKSFTSLANKSKRKSRGLKNIDSWANLIDILESMGANKGRKSLFLNWEESEKPQFDLLLKLMSQLTNINLTGNYSEVTNEWRIFS